jgi:hypothetical protein
MDTTGRLALQQPGDSDGVDKLRTSIANNAEATGDAALILTGDADDRPTAGTAGRFYYASDTGALSYDTGSAWIGVVAGASVSAFILTLLDDPNAATARGTLGAAASSDVALAPTSQTQPARALSTVYQPSTSRPTHVLANFHLPTGTSVQIKVDTSNPPTTVRATLSAGLTAAGSAGTAAEVSLPASFIVPANHRYLFTPSGSASLLTVTETAL